MASVRIRNQYLNAILATAVSLGSKKVSCVLLVEAWQKKGRDCDDVFFMHLDVLFSYQFLEKVQSEEQLISLESLLADESVHDYLFSVTHEGREFLHRYG